jgi:hypothetical protein
MSELSSCNVPVGACYGNYDSNCKDCSFSVCAVSLRCKEATIHSPVPLVGGLIEKRNNIEENKLPDIAPLDYLLSGMRGKCDVEKIDATETSGTIYKFRKDKKSFAFFEIASSGNIYFRTLKVECVMRGGLESVHQAQDILKAFLS